MLIGIHYNNSIAFFFFIKFNILYKSVRGILGAMMATSQYFGILLSYIIGAFVPYSYVPYVLLPIPIIFFLSFIFIPESPMFLIKQNKRKEAENSLKFYKNCQSDRKEDIDRFNIEWKKLLAFNQKITNVNDKFVFKDFGKILLALNFF